MRVSSSNGKASMCSISPDSFRGPKDDRDLHPGIFVLGVGVCFLLKPTFSATSLIMPPQQGQSLATMMGQLNALMSLTGGGGIGGSGLKTPVDMYVGMLESRTIADRLIAGSISKICTRREIWRIHADPEGQYAFSYRKRWSDSHHCRRPRSNRASEMANAYVDELYS